MGSFHARSKAGSEKTGIQRACREEHNSKRQANRFSRYSGSSRAGIKTDRNMKKYISLFHINWQNSLQYRFSLVVYIGGYSIYIGVLLYFWSAIYSEGQSVGNYTLSQLITYYILQLMINSIIFSFVSWDVIDNIKTGNFSNFLTKPLDYYMYWFTINISGKMLEAVFIMITAGIISLFLSDYVFFSQPLVTLFYFLISIILGII